MPDSHSESAEPPRRGRIVRIRTGSRLHFGLANTVSPFGGIGLMIDRPQTELIVRPAVRFCCDPSVAHRVGPIAQRISSWAGLDRLPPCRIEVVQQAESHCGLGSGTQLALAAAEAICRSLEIEIEPHLLATDLAQRALRSAVGAHGYFHGGLIYESGRVGGGLNPIEQRAAVPDSWCVAVLRPQRPTPRISGDYEKEQFSGLAPASESITSRIGELAIRITAAARNRDFQSFSVAVQQYNYQCGLLFAPVQGGPYNGEAVSAIVNQLCDQGAQGVGQSSWGPGVFAWFESRASAQALIDKLSPKSEIITLAHPQNVARQIQQR